MAFTSCAIAGRGAFHLFTPPPRDLPHARCSPRSGPRGRTSHAAQDPAHLSTMWPSGDICRRSSVGRAPRQEVCRWFESHRLHHRRDLLPRSRTERKPAEVVFPVRCTKAAGRSNLCIGWHRLCKDERMRPTYRRRAEKFRGWFGCRRVRRKSEAKPVDVEAAWWRLSLDKAAV